MKKIEAMELAPQRSKLLLDYVYQILSDEEQIEAKINIVSAKIEKEHMAVYEIIVPKRNFKRAYNTEITTQQKNVLDMQILNDLADNYLSDENVGLSKFYWYRGNDNFNGIDIIGKNGTRICINFGNIDREIEENYNARLNEFINYNQNNKAVQK